MSALKVAAPRDWDEIDVALGAIALAEDLLGTLPVEDVQKSLKNPLPAYERANARKSFLQVQGAYRDNVRELVATLDDFSQTVEDAMKTHRLAPDDKAFSGMLDRMHLRATAQFQHSFRMTYPAAFELGLRAAGASRGMAPNEQKVVDTAIRNEREYAKNFSTDVTWREGRMNYLQRADLYANALEELYWLGFVYADLSRDRYMRWIMAPVPTGKNWGEHKPCIDCSWISGNFVALERFWGIDQDRAKAAGAGGRWGNGVYLAQELARMAVVPQSGKLTCTTKCKCKLRGVAKPKREPAHRRLLPWKSQLPKTFTGTVDVGDGQVVMDRQHKTKRRKKYAKQAEATEHRHIRRN
jgi:hypothetical protein